MSEQCANDLNRGIFQRNIIEPDITRLIQHVNRNGNSEFTALGNITLRLEVVTASRQRRSFSSDLETLYSEPSYAIIVTFSHLTTV